MTTCFVLPSDDIKSKIRKLFSRPGEVLSDADVEEMFQNLIGFVVAVG